MRNKCWQLQYKSCTSQLQQQTVSLQLMKKLSPCYLNQKMLATTEHADGHGCSMWIG